MSHVIHIAVGSKSPPKITAVTNAARTYWGESVTISATEVPSNVPAQPLGHEETQQGAINRARAVLTATPGATLGIGLEGGVVDMAGNPVLMGYCAITDGMRTVVVPSAGIPLPHAWGEALKNGAELRPLLQAAGLMHQNDTDGTSGLLTNGAYKRDAMFTACVLTALAPWVNPVAYDITPIKAAS